MSTLETQPPEPSDCEALRRCLSTLAETITDPIILKSTIAHIASGATEKSFAPKVRGSSRRATGISLYHRSASDGDAFIAQHVERLRQLGERLPPDQEKAEKHVRQTFKKSPHVYRENPDGSWGLLKRTR